jgi:hypothetical protein
MSAATAYTMTVKCMNYCYGGSPALEVDEYPDEFCVVKYADHLAALERVRVETLLEARRTVGDRYDWQRNEFAPWGIKPLPDDQRFLDGIEDALAAIDRLIDATTTGATNA